MPLTDLPSALTFGAALLLSCGLMKAVSFWTCPAKDRPPARSFWLSPLFATVSAERIRPLSRERILRIAARAAWMAGGLALGYSLAPWLRPRTPRWAWSYLAMPLIPLYGGFAGTMLQLAGALVNREIVPDHHRHPWRSASIGDFWGRQWNTWLSDWFRQVIFLPLRRKPALATFATFLFSGLWHEAIIALPVFVWTGRSSFGLLTGYFLLQFVGMTAERRLPRRARRGLFFLVVGGASPLFMNEATLRVLLLWPGG